MAVSPALGHLEDSNFGYYPIFTCTLTYSKISKIEEPRAHTFLKKYYFDPYALVYYIFK